jgi:hypothetical protein
MDREDALDYLEDFDLNAGLLGRVLTAGRQHTIFMYGDEQVLKLPNRSLYMRVYGGFTHEIVQRDVDILTEHLPAFIVNTRVLASRDDDEDYAVLQDYLPTARFMSGRDYDRYPQVREQFAEIVRANQHLNDAHRLSIDFFGNQSFRQSLLAALIGRREGALLNNILIIEADGAARLVITDVNLSELRLGWTEDVNFFHWLIDRALFVLTRWMLRRLFAVRA